MNEEQLTMEERFILSLNFKEDHSIWNGDGWTPIAELLHKYKTWLIEQGEVVSRERIQKAFEDGVEFSDAFGSKRAQDQPTDTNVPQSAPFIEYINQAGLSEADKNLIKGVYLGWVKGV